MSTWPANAGPDSYRCIITRVETSEARYNADWVESTAKGTPIVIHRRSGLVIHPILGNSGLGDPVIVDPGGSGNGYLLLSFSRAGGFMNVYRVQEWAETPRKPFFAAFDYSAFFGYCM